jgi:alpha-beta hydrolase superfamily lysophospholipase
VLLALFGGLAWYFSGRVESAALASTPAGYQPVYDDVRITAVTPTTVTLAKGPDVADNFAAPAIYGLAWAGGNGHIGLPTVNSDGTVTRPLTIESGTAPTAGAMAAVDRSYWFGIPTTWAAEATGATARTAYGVVIGGNPAWFFASPTGDNSTVAIFVHGQNGTRLDGLRFVDVARRAGVASLVISYRNDVGAPADPSGRLQYGQTEWRDLDAAVTWAKDNGANRVVIVGQSMGGAIVAAFLENSSQKGDITGVVLDAPMLSLDDVVTNGSRSALPGGLAVPTPVIKAAEQIVTWRYGVDWAATDYLDDTSWVRVPTLVLQGAQDPKVPLSIATDLKGAQPDLVTLHVFPTAQHAESWNADRETYTQVVRSYLEGVTAS